MTVLCVLPVAAMKHAHRQLVVLITHDCMWGVLLHHAKAFVYVHRLVYMPGMLS